MKKGIILFVIFSIVNSISIVNSLLPLHTAWSAPSLPDILITEVMIDPLRSPETDFEWIEIYNFSDHSIFVDDLVLKDNRNQDVLPTFTIPAEGFHLFAIWNDAIPNVATSTITLIPDGKIGNGLANSGDRLVLQTIDGLEIDSISWGSDSSQLSPSIKKPSAGHSLHRYPINKDTDSNADFIELENPTPNAPYEKSTPIDEGTISDPGDILITEILADPSQSPESAYEWFEIFNNTTEDKILRGWSIRDNNQIVELPEIEIATGDFVAIVTSERNDLSSIVPNGKLVNLAHSLGNGLANSGDRLMLFDSEQTVIDQVSWGSDTTIFDPAPPSADESLSLQRYPNGQDTDTDSDFLAAEITPGLAFTRPAPPIELPGTIASPGEILITEVMPDSSCSPESACEWFELFNTTNKKITLRDWHIVDNNQTTSLPEKTIPPAGYAIFVASEQGIQRYDLPLANTYILSAAIGNGLANSGDRLHLLDSKSTIIDEISWGTDKSIFDPSLKSPQENYSLQWYQNDHAAQLALSFIESIPTPGYAYEPPPPIVYSDAIKINEILPSPGSSHDWDQDGTADSQDEFIELINTSSQSVDLRSWVLDDISAGGSKPFTIPNETTISAHGVATFYKQDSGDAKGTHIIQNNDHDCIRLLDPDEVEHDSFCYESTETDVAFARDPEDLSWSLTEEPTPGASNIINSNNTLGVTADDENSNYSDEIFINEILPSPKQTDWDANGEATSYDEWIELFNRSEQAVDLSGWLLDDAADGGSRPHAITGQIIIPAHSYLTIFKLDSKNRPGHHLSLNNDYDCVRLLDPSGRLHDEICYEDVESDHSFARLPDNFSIWSYTELPTPGDKNKIVLSASDEDNIPLSSISEIKTLELKTSVHIQAYVTSLPHLLGKNRIYLQDKDGNGIAVESYKGNYPDLDLGDFVDIKATLREKNSEYFLKTTLDEIHIISSNEQIPPTMIRTGSVGELVEAKLVKLNGRIVRQSGSTFYVDDGSGIVKIVIKSSTDIIKPKMKKGNWVTITGIVSQYKTKSTKDDGYRVLPRVQSDIQYGLAGTGMPVQNIALPLILLYTVVAFAFVRGKNNDKTSSFFSHYFFSCFHPLCLYKPCFKLNRCFRKHEWHFDWHDRFGQKSSRCQKEK